MNDSFSSLRVLHVVEATTAGVGRHVLDLSVHMHRLGIDVTVACPLVRENARRDIGFVDRLRQAGVTTAIVPMQRSIRPVADFRAYRHLVQLMDGEAYNLVHAHSSKAGVLGRLAAWRAGVPAIIYTPNAFAFLGTRNRLFFWLYRAIERWLGQHVTQAVVCVSASEVALAQRERIVPADRLVLIENAIDVSILARSEDKNAARVALGLNPDRPVVGFIGRLAAQKGIECVVEAAHLAVDRGVDAQFVLVGEGELEDTVRQMIVQHHLEAYVALAGYRQDIPQVMAAIDIFVLPSMYEGLSYALMEAMAAGRAIIATTVMGNRDLIQNEETGLLVPPGDACALAGAMARLLSRPDERERLGSRAQAAALARPTPEQVAQQMIALYVRILEQP
jgi:glycosyltransferase involved in cell wall biosynthesis